MRSIFTKIIRHYYDGRKILNNLLVVSGVPQSAGGRSRPRVGVHIRVGDIMLNQRLRRVFWSSNKDYLDAAFEWFTTKYANKLSPIFIVMCGGGFHGNAPDLAVCKDMVDTKKYTVAFSQNLTAAEDFVALTACDDVVVTSGTFGWWAGFLAGGDVVAYHQQIHGPLTNQYNEEDYFPPMWTLLEEAK
jgi:hypothetical protein